MPEEIQGQIDCVIFANPENGFTIAKAKVRGIGGLVTVVGCLMSPLPGEVLTMQGEWTQHPKYGEQFKVDTYRTTFPASITGIQKYLGSGLIQGIGPKNAERIVAHFGKETLAVIDTCIERLQEVPGIGEKRVRMIRQAWNDQKDIRNVMLFLQSHGVSSAYASRIYKQYGPSAVAKVKSNPYRLASDVSGIGFLLADRIAEQLGFPKNSDARIAAGLLYVLQTATEEGHVFYPYGRLCDRSAEMLEVERKSVETAMERLTAAKEVVLDDTDTSAGPNQRAVYLPRLLTCEQAIADHLQILAGRSASFAPIQADRALAWLRKRLPLALVEKQAQAIHSALTRKVLVVTGGPGTGKTTIVNAVVKIFGRLKLRVLLAAPTGRAAKRMSETSNHAAQTIHRLLEFSIQKGGFQRNDENPLACDLLVLDEASMIDTVLMAHLLRAVPPGAVLILVGDVHQLPSVGPGNVLRDIIESGTVAVVELTDIFRQAEKSRIIVAAHEIHRGTLPQTPSGQAASDFYFIQQEEPETVLKTILELVCTRIPRRFDFDPLDDIQVLTPMHKGIVGTTNLNAALQKALNPGKTGIARGNLAFHAGDKVMQVKNNYEKEVFNGDIGRIRHIDPEERQVHVAFEGRTVIYPFMELDELQLAYAISIHKAQGSEYPAVVIPLTTQHYILLQRNLVYTAVTRGAAWW